MRQRCEIAPPIGHTPRTAEVCVAIINEVHKVNSTGATRSVCAQLAWSQFAGGKVDKLWGGCGGVSGGTPEECRPLPLYCDGECRAAASSCRPSASSQSWVGYSFMLLEMRRSSSPKTLEGCWEQVDEIHHQNISRVELRLWAFLSPRWNACPNHAFLHSLSLSMFVFYDRQKWCKSGIKNLNCAIK